ncbi:MAG: transposase [candidate division Zixibacteria bacterium]|nr:transposase [candidate division Zixibacteria bacterium]
MLTGNADLLAQAVIRARAGLSFRFTAWVIMPNHFHAILHAPDGNVSDIVHRIKLSFSLKYARRHKTAGKVWQRRFWDHIVRDDDDMLKHVDYIHYNPVRHGYVMSPGAWRLSTFRRYCRRGIYGVDWGAEEPDWGETSFGE